MTLNELFARFDKLAWVSKHHQILIKPTSLGWAPNAAMFLSRGFSWIKSVFYYKFMIHHPRPNILLDVVLIIVMALPLEIQFFSLVFSFKDHRVIFLYWRHVIRTLLIPECLIGLIILCHRISVCIEFGENTCCTCWSYLTILQNSPTEYYKRAVKTVTAAVDLHISYVSLIKKKDIVRWMIAIKPILKSCNKNLIESTHWFMIVWYI